MHLQNLPSNLQQVKPIERRQHHAVCKTTRNRVKMVKTASASERDSPSGCLSVILESALRPEQSAVVTATASTTASATRLAVSSCVTLKKGQIQFLLTERERETKRSFVKQSDNFLRGRFDSSENCQYVLILPLSLDKP